MPDAPSGWVHRRPCGGRILTVSQFVEPSEPRPQSDTGRHGSTNEVAGHALVRLDRGGGVATITLDSPHNRNALSARLRAELRDALDVAASDDATRVVVLTHTGPVFCAGMDLKETAVAAAGSEGVRELPGILQRVARCPKPVIARVAGAARAGGVGILAAADVVLAAPRATFAFTEVRIGLIPAVISVPVLDRMSTVEARELLLTGEVFDAERGQRAGLVNAVAHVDHRDGSYEPDDELAALDDLVSLYVAALLQGGPLALAGTKALLRRDYDDSDERYADLLELSAVQFSSGEGREGALAFAQKRPPTWQVGPG
jgi:methylglutaconyl-CoA hydratase